MHKVCTFKHKHLIFYHLCIWDINHADIVELEWVIIALAWLCTCVYCVQHTFIWTTQVNKCWAPSPGVEKHITSHSFPYPHSHLKVNVESILFINTFHRGSSVRWPASPKAEPYITEVCEVTKTAIWKCQRALGCQTTAHRFWQDPVFSPKARQLPEAC